MELHDLRPAEGSTKKRKRIARGEGSGKGGTSTKGHKGQKSRSGYKRKKGFEGGQMPIQRIVPKFGFKNINRVAYKAVNLADIQKLSDKTEATAIGIEALIQGGLVSKNDKVKILGDGELTGALEVTAHAFSKSAKEAIEGKNGKIISLQAQK